MAKHSSARLPELPQPLPLPVVDNHAHLDIRRDDAPALPGTQDVAGAIELAASVGVDRMVQIGCDLESARFTVAVIDEHPSLLGGVALHPNEAPKIEAAGQVQAARAEIEELAQHPRVRVIGETGLDYFRTGPEGQRAQEDSFRWHIDLAKRTGKALQIHDRDAHDDVLRILDDEGAPEKVVLHCFSGDSSFARACLERGFYLSFAGTITFKSAAGLRDAAAIAPLDRVLVETDAPYLTPAPYRGAVNASALMPHTVRALAGALMVDATTLCAQVSRTSELVYGPWSHTANS